MLHCVHTPLVLDSQIVIRASYCYHSYCYHCYLQTRVWCKNPFSTPLLVKETLEKACLIWPPILCFQIEWLLGFPFGLIYQYHGMSNYQLNHNIQWFHSCWSVVNVFVMKRKEFLSFKFQDCQIRYNGCISDLVYMVWISNFTHSMPWDAVTYQYPIYLLLAPKSS